MANIFQYDDYRLYVRDAINQKQSDSVRKLSLRSIAYKMDLSPAYLSTVMNKKKHLSVDASLKIANWLDLNPTETEYLTGMIQATHETDEHKILKIQKKLDSIAHSHRRKKVETIDFEKILDLNHISTLVLMTGAYAQVTAADLEKLLSVTASEAQRILANLSQAGLVKSVGAKFERTEDCSHILQSATPSTAIRSYYKQMLDRSKWAIDNLPMRDRYVGTETIILDPTQVEEANNIIEECFNRVTALSQQAKTKSNVYALGIQLFRVTSENV